MDVEWQPQLISTIQPNAIRQHRRHIEVDIGQLSMSVRFVRTPKFEPTKCCALHEWPQCESCTAALVVAVKGRLGPIASSIAHMLMPNQK